MEWRTYSVQAFILTFHQLFRANFIGIQGYTWINQYVDHKLVEHGRGFTVHLLKEGLTEDIHANKLLQSIGKYNQLTDQVLNLVIRDCIESYVGTKGRKIWSVFKAKKDDPHKKFLIAILETYLGKHGWIDLYHREQYYKLITTSEWFFKESIRQQLNLHYRQVYWDLRKLMKQVKLYREFIWDLEKTIARTFSEKFSDRNSSKSE